MKILANDGISQSGIDALEKGGFEVLNVKVAQNQLENYINENNIDAILVGNTTQVRQELMEACPSLKLIGCAGVELDNIDVDYAEDNGLIVINTPSAPSSSVAELVFAHLFGMVRFLHSSKYLKYSCANCCLQKGKPSHTSTFTLCFSIVSINCRILKLIIAGCCLNWLTVLRG